MGPLEVLGFASCLWALGFVAALGLTMGAYVGLKVAAMVFGPVSVQVQQAAAVRVAPLVGGEG